ncbi:TipJ family phage tail tip protein [Pseudomonas fluorescens]|uniref:Host specificity protein n=1 Tax=Pseudomonas fluorescens TaxID=294 RepID=A0A2T0HM49_PSEFL|nr:phage tail protein [Pseudomonas fluorescens]PRW84174.1 host specificity protein [Pseudomonas fluorescens]
MSAAAKKTSRAAARTRRAVIGGKGGQAKEKRPSIAQNSVPSISTARILYMWSWGPIVGPVDGLRSIKLDGTPIQGPDGTLNYPGVKWQFRNGELNQARLEGNTESSNEIDVKQELIFGTPWLHSITNPVLDAVRLRLSWPVLRSQDAAGNINGVRIDYAVDISTDNGPYLEALVSFVDRKNVTEYERAHRLELPAGNRWTVRVRRLTPNANSDLVVDQMVVKAIAEVVDSDQEYPLTAVSSIEYDAQTFGGDIAKIAVLMRGRIIRVPTNYNPETRTYSTSGTGTSNGIWDGTFKEAYTNNPAWIFYDLVLHPYYGLGDRIDATMVDRWSLYRIAQYCDQMVPDGKGGMEPRFTCNLYFQKQAEAYAVLQDLASIFHGLAYWDGSQIVVNADMPGDPVFTYNQTQILNNGAVKYEGTRARDRHTLYMVGWDNPDQGFETDKEPVFDDEAMIELGGIVRETTVGAIGCTSLGQAQRAGQWAALTEKLQTQGGVFRVGLDGDIPKPGQVIAVADPMLVGRKNGGRIAAAAGRLVTLDRDTVVPVGARLLVNLPSGKSEGRVVKSVAGRDVTVMADFSEQPQAECGWILDYEDLKLMQFYVRNVTRPEWHQFQLEVIQHDPSKFGAIDNGAVVDPRPITGIPIGSQDAPARVMLSQHVVIEQGIAVTVMSIAWDAAPNAVAYDVEWKWGAREWIRVPRTAEQMVDVRGIYSGQYMARVRAVSALNVSSIPATSALTNLEGKTGLPPAVSFLTTKSLVYGIGIQWGFPPGAEDTERTEIWYSQSADRATAIKLSDFSYPQAKHEMHSLLAGASLFFWARLVDRTGNVGPFFPIPGAVNGQASSKQSDYEAYYAEKIGKGALYQSLREEIELITGDGPGSVNERLEEAKQELKDLIDQVSDALAYDPAKPYLKGDIVRLDQRLYQAKGPVPAGKTPPDVTYWIDIGTILETTDALVSQVQIIETKIEEIDGKVLATATSVEALRSAARGDDGAGDLADAVKGWTSTADLAVERKTRASENDAMAQQLLNLGAQVGDNKSSLTVLEQVVASNRETSAAQITKLNSDLSAVDEKASGTAQALTSLDTKVTNLDGKITSQASSNEALRASVRGDDGSGDLAGAIKAWESTASFAAEKVVQASANEALTKTTETLQSSIGQTSASVQTVSETVVRLDGRVSAQTTMKAQTIVDGRKVVSGLAFGSNGEQSEFLIFAQRFGVVNEIDGKIDPMFVIENGQAVFNTAIISKAIIQEIVLGMVLRSPAVDSLGRPLLEINIPAGTFTLRSAGTGGSSLLNNDGLTVFDAGGVDRVSVGRLSV